MSEDGYKLAYEEAKRTLEDQSATVNEFRSRAGILVAAAAITTSFFGGRVLATDTTRTEHIPFAAWVAIGGLAALGACVLVMLWPRRDWEFNINAESLIENYLESELGPLPIESIHRDLALHMSRSADVNRRQLRWLFNAFPIRRGPADRRSRRLGCGSDRAVLEWVIWPASPSPLPLRRRPCVRALCRVRRRALTVPRATELRVL